MKWGKIMKKKFVALTLAMTVLLMNVPSLYAFENPGIIVGRAGKYHVNLPTSSLDYIVDKTTEKGLDLINPLFGSTYLFVKGAASVEINGQQVNLANKVMTDLISGEVEDKVLSAISEKSLKKLASGVLKFKTVTDTYKEIKENLKNDTTDYELNLVMDRHLSIISSSQMAAMYQYTYARVALKELMDAGHIKVKMAPKYYSSFRSEITISNYGKEQIKKIREDLSIIEKAFKENKIA